jgi:uncharacterized protein (TIGR02147 family)
MNYYTNWYYIPIRELVAHKEFTEDPLWIAKRLDPEITSEQAAKALIQLEQIGLLVRDRKGRLVQHSPDVKTEHEVASLLVSRYHKEMLRLSAEAIDRFRGQDREMSAATVLVSKQKFQELKRRIQEIREELVASTSNDPAGEIVCQLGIQLFPLSKLSSHQLVAAKEEEKGERA